MQEQEQKQELGKLSAFYGSVSVADTMVIDRSGSAV